MVYPKIGFVGQGWIGKNYADNFAERGYKIVRYSLEKKYRRNKAKIKTCDIVFIAVPTPTVNGEFQENYLIDALSNVGDGKIAVIKSTVQIGTTDRMQKFFPGIFMLHSPEFLTEKTAKWDSGNPDRNILGYTKKSFKRAGEVMNVLALAPYEAIVPCREAELIKYAGNCWFYVKIMLLNVVYDIADKNGLDYNIIKDAMAADKRIGRSHLEIEHQGGRGAGGHCFIKDFAAFKQMAIGATNDKGLDFLEAAEEWNKHLLRKTKKDLDLLNGVYENERDY